MDKIQRLVDAWGDDLGELVKLAELVEGIRTRGMAFQRELCARIADDVAADYLAADAPAGVHAALEIARLIRDSKPNGFTEADFEVPYEPPTNPTA